MAESELGVASLRIVVDTSAALSALAQFRTRFANEIDDLGTINFRGVERGAAEAGQRAGRAIRDGITNATANLRFDNIREALDFSDALDGTLRDLRQYREALVSLREVTPATAAGFGQLNDVIEAATQAIRNYTAGTDQLQDSARRINLRELNAQLREQRQEAAANARIDRQWADAIRTIESAQRGAATATRLANQAFRDQIGLVGTLAQKGARDIAKTVGGVGKGVAAAAKGAVNLGKFGYELGAEFGVFEAPRTGPIKEAIQQVADRFKFLGEQAQTTRGIILRAIEAAGTSAGLVELARNADLLKAALGGVDGAAQVASKGLGILDKVGGGFFDFLSNRFPDTAFGEFARLASGATDVAAGIGTATSSLTNFASQGLGASLDGLQALITALGNVPPEAQAAVLALAGLSLGFKEKPIVEGLTRVLEYLDGLSSKALKVRGDLSTVFKELGQFQEQLSKANSQTLLPAFKERGFTRLDDPENGALTESVQLADRYRRLTEAIGSNWERGARFLEKSTAEIERQIQLGIRQGPSNVFANGGTPAAANPQQYARPIGPVAAPPPALSAEQQLSQRRNQLLDDLDGVTARRLAAEKALLDLQTAAIDVAKRKLARQRALGDEQFAQLVDIGSTQRSDRVDRVSGARRRVSDAVGSGLIGGAFPLLFGQGIGASVGGGVLGAAGGALGGQFGFGLSLVGTAVGQAFDQMIEKGRTLASALQDPIANFNTLKEAGLISSKSLERTVAGLIETGRQAEATALLQKDLARFGGTAELKALNDAFDGATKAFSELGVAVAQFTAGPLTNFLTKLQGAIRLPVVAAQFDAQVGQLSPEQQKRQRELLKADFQKFAVGTGLSQGEAGVKAYQERLKAIKEIVGKTAEERIAEENLLRARKLYNDQIALSKSLIDAKYKGDEREINALERKKILLDLANKTFGLSAQDPRAQKANQDASEALYENAKQLEQLDAQRWANNIASANKLKSIQEQTAIESARPGLTGIGIGALNALVAFREAQRQEQNAQAQLRIKPGDTALQSAANEAAANVKLAAAKTKADLQDAFKAAQDAVRAISRSIEDSVLALQQAQNQRGAGLNEFLSPQQVTDRQQQVNQQLSGAANELIKQLRDQLGLNVQFSLTGTTEQRNAALGRFLTSGRQEVRAVQDIRRQEEDLRKAQADLAIAEKSKDAFGKMVAQNRIDIASGRGDTASTMNALATSTVNQTVETKKLTDAIAALTSKPWDVVVNVAANGQASVYGDAVNGGF